MRSRLSLVLWVAQSSAGAGLCHQVSSTCQVLVRASTIEIKMDSGPSAVEESVQSQWMTLLSLGLVSICISSDSEV